MPKILDTTFAIPEHNVAETHVLDLLGGMVRTRPLSGEEAYQKLLDLEARAQANDPEAQTDYARYLLTHEQNATNNRKAVRLLKKALPHEHPETLYLWGLVLMRGQGQTRHPEVALQFFERAALLGHVNAQADLARALDEGIGIAKDPTKALYWYRLAGAAGHHFSQRQAGLAYKNGVGTSVDLHEAKKWLTLAAQVADPIAQYELARLYGEPNGQEHDRQEADKWLHEAALSGEINAQYQLGIAYWIGRGQRVDLREALRWTSRAAENGDTRALTTLAGFFQTGTILPINRFKAYILLKAASAHGDLTAKHSLPSLDRLLTFREKREAARLVRHYSDLKSLVELMLPRSER